MEFSTADRLADVVTPTTVIHRVDDRAAPVEQGRALAAGIPGAMLVELSGRNHLPYVGDVDEVLTAIRRALGLPKLRRRAAPSLTSRQLEVAALVAFLCSRDLSFSTGAVYDISGGRATY